MGAQETTTVVVTDKRRPGWFWIGNATLSYLPKVGASAWAVYCALASVAGVARETETSYRALRELTGLSEPTIIKSVEALAAVGLLTVTTRAADNGRYIANAYELLEPVLVGPRKATPAAEAATPALDAWASDPLAAALKEMGAGGNKLAPLARLYGMRFETTVWPFDFARMGALVKRVSSGERLLAQAIWYANPKTITGNPMDYFTAVVGRTKAAAPGAPRPPADDDPQLAALAAARGGAA